MTAYVRPLLRSGVLRPDDALCLAGGDLWFSDVALLSRDRAPRIVSACALDPHWQARLTTPRAHVAGLDLNRPNIMGILNVTPDSFSDGGQHNSLQDALRAAKAMVDAGANIIDIGGESTRPGAEPVSVEQEIARTAPVIAAVIAALDATDMVPISIDTRKAAVARAALHHGATMVNDVSGLTYDDALAPLCADTQVPVCVMHARGIPATMQTDPHYDNVLLDVYDALDQQITHLIAMGLPRHRIIVDPGIGFGKTQPHNLTLLQNISLFHSLGCAILLGVSRKRFIGDIGQVPVARDRVAGSIAVGLSALAQGVQLLRVHDVAETAQAVRLWRAVT